MNTAVGIFVIAASAVGVIAGVVALVRFLTGLQDKFEEAVDKVIGKQIVEIKRQLTTEFSGNGGGAREAINKLGQDLAEAVRVDKESHALLAEGQEKLLDRMNVLENERVKRAEDTQ